jgi:N-acetylglutamate synthase
VNAWPAATVEVADGWLLRHTPAVARRRSNSALPPPSAAPTGPARRAQALELVERFYARHDQPALVQVSPAELHGALDRELANRGWRHQAPTVVLTVPIARLPSHPPTAPTLALSVAATATPRWLAATHGEEVLGVGLLVAEQGWAVTHGAHHLYLLVEENNTSALRLYRRPGFHPSHHYHYRTAPRP